MHLLRRRKWTGSQVGRKRDERLTGVSGAFALCTRQKIPEYVVLIDDLSTTGSTLDACAEPLKKAGVPRVEALLVASRL